MQGRSSNQTDSNEIPILDPRSSRQTNNNDLNAILGITGTN